MAGDTLHEVGKQLRNIFAAVAQGGNRNAQGSKEICQLRGKAARAYQRSKAMLCEGDDAWSLWSVSVYQTKQCSLDDGR